MARQRKALPARRKNAIDTSLLIRSAESLGRVIGLLQRQIDAARQLTSRSAGAEPRGNGHTAVRTRTRASGASLKSKTTAKANRRAASNSSRRKERA